MDRVRWMTLGGRYIMNDEPNFQDIGIINEFRKAHSWLGTNFIISGCTHTLTGGNDVYTAGVFFLNGEALELSATSINHAALPYQYVEVDEQDAVGGDVGFEDGTTHNLWAVRTAKIVGYATAQTGGVLYSDLTTMNNPIKELAFSAQSVTISGGAISLPAKGGVVLVNGGGTLTTVTYPTTKSVSYLLVFTSATTVQGSLVTNGLIVNGGLNTAYFEAYSSCVLISGTIGQIYGGGVAPDTWHSVGASGQPAFLSGTAWQNLTFKYKKEDSWIIFQGDIKVADETQLNGGGGAVFNLPVGYRPTNGFIKPIIRQNPNTNPATVSQSWCAVDSSGLVYVQFDTPFNNNDRFQLRFQFRVD